MAEPLGWTRDPHQYEIQVILRFPEYTWIESAIVQGAMCTKSLEYDLMVFRKGEHLRVVPCADWLQFQASAEIASQMVAELQDWFAQRG